jgi:hypothetical protein
MGLVRVYENGNRIARFRIEDDPTSPTAPAIPGQVCQSDRDRRQIAVPVQALDRHNCRTKLVVEQTR